MKSVVFFIGKILEVRPVVTSTGELARLEVTARIETTDKDGYHYEDSEKFSLDYNTYYPMFEGKKGKYFAVPHKFSSGGQFTDRETKQQRSWEAGLKSALTQLNILFFDKDPFETQLSNEPQATQDNKQNLTRKSA